MLVSFNCSRVFRIQAARLLRMPSLDGATRFAM
jgi:hypothetical protein